MPRNHAAAALARALRFARRDLAPSTARIDGATLQLYRVASGATAYEVATRLDVSKQRVSAMEDAGCSPEVAFRFRAAVDQIAAERERTPENGVVSLTHAEVERMRAGS